MYKTIWDNKCNIFQYSNFTWQKPLHNRGCRDWLKHIITNYVCFCRTLVQCWKCMWNAYSHSLTHWGRVTHICVGYLTIIGSDNGLSPGRRQAIIWINAEILLIGPLGINFSEILIEIKTFSFKKMHLKVSSAKRRPFCLGLNVLMSLIIHCCCYMRSITPHLQSC